MPRHNSGGYETEENRHSIGEFSFTLPAEVGITLVEPGSSTGIVIDGHQPITEFWQAFIWNEETLLLPEIAAEKVALGQDQNEIERLLDTLGITNNYRMGHIPRDLIHQLQRRPAIAKQGKQSLLEIFGELGTGCSKVEDILSMAKLLPFAYSNSSPLDIDVEVLTITVEMEYEKLKSMRPEQRSNVCELLHILSDAVDIRLSATRSTQAFLKRYHQQDLPCVNDWNITPIKGTGPEKALEALDPKGTAATILELLDKTPNQTLSYAEIYDNIRKSRSRVRQCLSELREYNLITAFDSPNQKKVALLDAGDEVLSDLQQRPRTRFPSEKIADSTPNPYRHRRDTERKEYEELIAEATVSPTQSERKSDSEYSTVRMRPSMQDAIAACGTAEGTITIVDDDVDHIDSSMQAFAVDGWGDEVFLSTHATTPLGYMMGSAMALAHPKLLHNVLDEHTLTEVLDDTPVEILSQARQIGYVPRDDIDADTLRQSLIKWRRDLKELIRRLKTDNDDTNEFASDDELCREILQQGHGLAGSVVHLLDEAGITVVRDIRVPADLNSSKLDDLAESIAHSVVVQSRYESFAAYRQLFESRDSHRKRTFTADVDAADPVGTLIGAFVLRGGSASRLRPALTTKLESYDPVDNAPEFEIPITLRDVTRENIAIATERVLERKRITPTQDAISILCALVESPFRVTKALYRLEMSSTTREITLSELRTALQRVSADHLLPNLPRSIGQIVEALLKVSEPITQSELATRADVTPQTIRNYEDAMESTGLVKYERTANGKEWRVTVPFSWEPDKVSLPAESDEAAENLIAEQCECSGPCVVREVPQLEDAQDDCPVVKWRAVQRRLTGGDGLRNSTVDELQVGKSPKQLWVFDIDELTEDAGLEQNPEVDRGEANVRSGTGDELRDRGVAAVSDAESPTDSEITTGDERAANADVCDPMGGSCGIPLARQPELSLGQDERTKIRSNWQEFVAHTSPPEAPFEWTESPLRDDLLQYCHQHSLIKQTDDGKWETTEDLWMFLLANAAPDEMIGAHLSDDERLVDASSRDVESVGQFERADDGQTTLASFKRTWVRRESSDGMRLTTPSGQVYERPDKTPDVRVYGSPESLAP